MPKPNATAKPKYSDTLLFIGILAIAFNLRPALAGIGPLIEDIRNDTALSNSLLGLLTTLPLIAFGVISTLAPLFTRRFGIGGTLFGAMALLAFGIAMRILDWLPVLYLGTILIGVGIAFGNVLLPSLTKRNFSEKSGLITSLYSSIMALGATVAAGISVPLANDLDLGWRWSLGIWSIPATLAVILWIPQLCRIKIDKQNRSFVDSIKNLANSTKAWQVALFMGLQSLTFYVVLAWLPAILQSRGFDAELSGWMLSLSQAAGILGSLAVPILAGRRKNQKSMVFTLVLLEIIALVGLLVPTWGMVLLWVAILGFVLGGTFGIALLFLVLRTKDTQSATELSGMAQSV